MSDNLSLLLKKVVSVKAQFMASLLKQVTEEIPKVIIAEEKERTEREEKEGEEADQPE